MLIYLFTLMWLCPYVAVPLGITHLDHVMSQVAMIKLCFRSRQMVKIKWWVGA